jgi:hypothetical protein
MPSFQRHEIKSARLKTVCGIRQKKVSATLVKLPLTSAKAVVDYKA